MSNTNIKSLFDAPSSSASSVEQADYIELLALRNADSDVSLQDLIGITHRMDDEDEPKGGVESDLKNENKAASALDEHTQRIRDLGPASYLYPYEVHGDLIAIRDNISNDKINFLYWFMLFATRLNMKSDRVHGGYDGADLFEHLCLIVAKNYFGTTNDSRVDGMVFGTARNKLSWEDDTEDISKFGQNVDTLCKRIVSAVILGQKHEGNLPQKTISWI